MQPYGPPQYPYAPDPYAGAYGAPAYPGQQVPPHLVGAPPPPGMKIVRKARVSAAIALPLFGLFIVGVVCPTLPWVDAGPKTFNLWELMSNLWDVGGEAMKTYSANYFGWLWLILVVWAFFLSMAGTLDSAVWRMVYAGVYMLLGLAVGGILLVSLLAAGALAGATNDAGYNTDGTGVALGVMGVFMFIGLVVFIIGAVLLFKLKGVAYRVLSGLGLMSFAFVHLTALLALPEGSQLEPWAYLSVFGYLLCALGCFIGPRYVRYYALA